QALSAMVERSTNRCMVFGVSSMWERPQCRECRNTKVPPTFRGASHESLSITECSTLSVERWALRVEDSAAPTRDGILLHANPVVGTTVNFGPRLRRYCCNRCNGFNDSTSALHRGSGSKIPV